MSYWRDIAIAGIMGIAIASLSKLPLPALSQAESKSVTPVTVVPSPVTIPATAATGKRMKIQISVTSPDDLKVKEGNKIDAGDVIADRDRERSRLAAQKQQLKLSLERISKTGILKPAAPAPVPEVKRLPPISYEEEKSRIDSAKLEVDKAREKLDIQQRKLDAIKLIPENDLPAAVVVHEEAVVRDAEQKVSEAEANLALVQSQLQSSKDQRAYNEYKASIEQAQRVEQENQAQLSYQRQIQEVQQQERDRQYQIAQVEAKLQEVDNAIAQLSTVKAPYPGVVKRIKWLGQRDNILDVELTLITTGTANTFTTANSFAKPTANSDTRSKATAKTSGETSTR